MLVLATNIRPFSGTVVVRDECGEWDRVDLLIQYQYDKHPEKVSKDNVEIHTAFSVWGSVHE